MQNIWIVNHSAIPPELGGLNRHYYFSKYLSEDQYQVRIITASAIHNTNVNIIEKQDKTLVREQSFDGVSYTFLKTSSYTGNGLSRIKNMLEFPWRFLRVYKRFEKPDIIYTSSPSPFAAYTAVRAAKKLKVPVIVEVRDLWPESIVAYQHKRRSNPVIWAMYRLEKWLYKHADRLIFTMEGGADYIREKGWEHAVDLKKVNNINNGVDLEEYRRNLSLSVEDDDLNDPDTFKVIYTGSIRRANNLDNVLTAAKLLQDTHPNIRFLLWGDGDCRTALMERCQDEDIRNVRFKGRVERKYIPSILSGSDINLVYFDPHGIGGVMRFGCSQNKLFDYFASAKPLVSNFRPKYDLIERYQCGIPIDTDTSEPEALVRAILKIYEMSDEEYRRLCENAARAAQDYDYRLLTRKLEEVIQSLGAEK